MKHIFITLISFYQLIVSPIFKQVLGVRSQCRYSPSCSHYAKEVISEHGVITGIGMAMRRLLSCQPFAKSYGSH